MDQILLILFKVKIWFLYYNQSTATKQNSYHWFLNILIERIPSYAQNHFMHISISNGGPSIVYTSRDIGWKAFDYLIRKVSCKNFRKYTFMWVKSMTELSGTWKSSSATLLRAECRGWWLWYNMLLANYKW